MKNVRVAINGFGRIGRLAFRQMFGAEGYEVVAINNRTYNPEMLAHLLKYDSTQGRYALCDKVSVEGDMLVIDGKKVKFLAEADATKLPWGEMNVDVVLEIRDEGQGKVKVGNLINLVSELVIKRD